MTDPVVLSSFHRYSGVRVNVGTFPTEESPSVVTLRWVHPTDVLTVWSAAIPMGGGYDLDVLLGILMDHFMTNAEPFSWIEKTHLARDLNKSLQQVAPIFMSQRVVLVSIKRAGLRTVVSCIW